MSHATVLVVTEQKPTSQDLEKIMAPYQEEGSMSVRTKYVEFVDETEEMKKEFTEETREVNKKLSDGSIHSPYSENFYREPTPEESEKGLHGMGFSNDISFDSRDWGDGKGYRAKAKYMPEGYEKVEVLHCDFYNSFEEFLTDWHGYEEENLKENGVVGYYTNPNSKWDWYQVGGRWAGFFKAKNEDLAEQGNKSWTNKSEEISGVDVIQKKNIDMEAMIQEAKETTEKYWEILLKHYPDLSLFPKKSWMDCVNEYRKDNNDEIFNREAIISIQENQDNFDYEKIESLKKEMKLAFDDPIDYFCKGNKDDFYKSMLYSQFGTYAILKDQFWYEKGQLGMFGVSHNEEENWKETFYSIFESINNESWLTIIDYHC